MTSGRLVFTQTSRISYTYHIWSVFNYKVIKIPLSLAENINPTRIRKLEKAMYARHLRGRIRDQERENL
jgi:hypothetical protein